MTTNTELVFDALRGGAVTGGLTVMQIADKVGKPRHCLGRAMIRLRAEKRIEIVGTISTPGNAPDATSAFVYIRTDERTLFAQPTEVAA